MCMKKSIFGESMFPGKMHRVPDTLQQCPVVKQPYLLPKLRVAATVEMKSLVAAAVVNFADNHFCR